MTVTKKGDMLVWEAEPLKEGETSATNFNRNFSQLTEFVKNICTSNSNYSSLKYTMYEKGYERGEEITEITKRRLFVHENTLCYYKPRGRRWGFPLYGDFFKVEVKLPSKKSPATNFMDNCDRILRHLEVDGLWEHLGNTIKMCKALGYERCLKYHDQYNYDWKTGLDVIVKMNNKVFFEILEILKNQGNSELIEHFMDMCLEDVTPTQLEKYFKDYNTTLPLINGKVPIPLKIIHQEFDLLNDKIHIKKMIFHKGVGYAFKTKETLERIALAMDENRACKEYGDNGYDVSFSYDPEKKKAWYSEEYRGCGNGYYYIALNRTHALFVEKD